MVAEALRERWTDLEIDTKTIRTSGDEGLPAAPSLPAGRKGLFTAEIERALLSGGIDLAVHSAKDLPSQLDAATQVAGALERGAVDDVLVSLGGYDLKSLPTNGIVATGSVRRRHQLHWKRPDLDVVDLRGNVPTRLRKLREGKWHAIILAQAGLERLALSLEGRRIRYEAEDYSVHPLPRDIFVPAGGQGIIAIQTRSDDEGAKALVEAITHFDTRLCLRAEREFLRLLQGDCDQPVGVFAEIEAGKLKMAAQVFDLEATTPRGGFIEGASEDAEKLAAFLWEQVK
jgi:hydroxymethylbilane synthase